MNTIEKALGKLKEHDAQKNVGNVASPDRRPASGSSSANMVNIDMAYLESKGIVTPETGRSQIAEEMRQIKRPLLRTIKKMHVGSADNLNTIMVTSALPGEGKTFTAVNLAMSIAMELDHTCLLIDADVMRPNVMRTLGVQYEGKGLVDYLVDRNFDLSDILLKTNIPTLSVLPAGRPHSHATELLASDSMTRMLTELAERYHDRVIIFDSPPLLATSEARVLAGAIGQIVVVVEAIRTEQSIVKSAVELLDRSKTIGMVLNKSRIQQSHGYYYSNYSSENDEKPV